MSYNFSGSLFSKWTFGGLHIRLNRTNPKNNDTLYALDFNADRVKNVLKKLELEDYSEGPVLDTLYRNSDLWVFGKIIKGREVYIKIQLGEPGSNTICISFHFSEYTMNYPYKKQCV